MDTTANAFTTLTCYTALQGETIINDDFDGNIVEGVIEIVKDESGITDVLSGEFIANFALAEGLGVTADMWAGTKDEPFGNFAGAIFSTYFAIMGNAAVATVAEISGTSETDD